MTKKITFLPALKSQGNFSQLSSVHSLGVEFMDHRDKIKLYMPDKNFSKDKKDWKLQKTCDGNLF